MTVPIRAFSVSQYFLRFLAYNTFQGAFLYITYLKIAYTLKYRYLAHSSNAASISPLFPPPLHSGEYDLLSETKWRGGVFSIRVFMFLPSSRVTTRSQTNPLEPGWRIEDLTARCL